MAKGKGRRIRASQPGGRPDMRQQIMKLQEQMLQTQEELGDQTVTATAGGGVIEVVMTGHQRVASITILLVRAYVTWLGSVNSPGESSIMCEAG